MWNADNDTFHVMDVELLMKKAVFKQKSLEWPNLKLEIDTNWVRAYRLSLTEGVEFKSKNKKHSLVFISLSAAQIEARENGKTSIQTLGSGSFFVINRRQFFSIKNLSGNTTQFILLELPNRS